jgi:hypothetical protein
MFRKRQRQMDNTAAASINLPRPVSSPTIHNHAPSEAARIFAWALVVFIGLVVAWFFVLYLISEMGYRNPVRVMGWVLAGVSSLLFATIVIDRTITKFYKMNREYAVQLEELRLEQSRHLALTTGAPALPSKRLTAEQIRLFENLALVMQRAYQDLADSKGAGYQGGSDKRPWSKRSVLAMEPPRHGKMPDSKATEIREWLAANEVIIGPSQSDQINTELYPTWADFRALLEEKFNMPVKVYKGPSSPTDSRYVPIDV